MPADDTQCNSQKVNGYTQQLTQILLARILLFMLLLLGFVSSLFVLTTKRFPRSDGFILRIHLGKSRLKTFREKKSQRWLTKLSVHRTDDTSNVAGWLLVSWATPNAKHETKTWKIKRLHFQRNLRALLSYVADLMRYGAGTCAGGGTWHFCIIKRHCKNYYIDITQ